jgi:hypothetical protein
MSKQNGAFSYVPPPPSFHVGPLSTNPAGVQFHPAFLGLQTYQRVLPNAITPQGSNPRDVFASIAAGSGATANTLASMLRRQPPHSTIISKPNPKAAVGMWRI